MAKNDEQTGWWALALAITQNLSAGRALSAMNGRGETVRRLGWQEFVAQTIAEEQRRLERRRREGRTERARAYQREYQRQYRKRRAAEEKRRK
jgi:hypothetical protein